MKTSLNPITILKSSYNLWRKNFVKITLATVIVAVPGSFIRVYQFDGVNDASIITSFAGLYLCVMLIWSFFNIDQIKKNSFLKLYILSSARFLPYLFASLLFAIICMPALLSVLLIILAVSTQIPWAFSIFGVGIILAILYLVIRFSLATTLVVQNDITAFNAMRLSWQISKGRIVMIGLSWLVALGLVVVLSGVIFSLINLISVLASSAFVQLLLNGILLSIFLPLFVSYGVELVKRLEQ